MMNDKSRQKTQVNNCSIYYLGNFKNFLGSREMQWEGYFAKSGSGELFLVWLISNGLSQNGEY